MFPERKKLIELRLGRGRQVEWISGYVNSENAERLTVQHKPFKNKEYDKSLNAQRASNRPLGKTVSVLEY